MEVWSFLKILFFRKLAAVGSIKAGFFRQSDGFMAKSTKNLPVYKKIVIFLLLPY